MFVAKALGQCLRSAVSYFEVLALQLEYGPCGLKSASFGIFEYLAARAAEYCRGRVGIA